ncbi:chromatin assembly factor 1 subunit A-domain-containing protein [Gongronella butleri]|nr:chromatin assembly factor 1 subunit A-domain-containing protein [Gongronella butleri]
MDYRDLRQKIEPRVAKGDNEQALVPESFLPILAMLIQDSDESIQALVHRLNELLSPFNRDEQVAHAFNEAIEERVRSIATFTRYGLELRNPDGQAPTPVSTFPLHLSISRWESNDLARTPLDFQQLVSMRRNERIAMSLSIVQLFGSLSPEQQHYLVTPPRQRKTQPQVEEHTIKIKSPEEVAAEQEKQKKKETERAKKEEEKRKREQDKKKREEERKRKEQSQLRLTSLFKQTENKYTTSQSQQEFMPSMSMFPPFFVKDHVQLNAHTPIHVDREEFATSFSPLHNIISMPTVSGDLRQSYLAHLQQTKPELTRPRRQSKHVNLRELFTTTHDLDAACQGNALTMKLLQFTEDVRPAYYGTWNKQSTTISAKNPFTMDNEMVNYDHDSEAEWEPEGEGEDIRSGDEDDEDIAETGDPEDVGWLVPEGYLSDGEGVDDGDEEGIAKVVQRLTVRSKSRKIAAIRPIVVGPLFEYNNCSSQEALRPFRLHFISGSQTGINPFQRTKQETPMMDSQTEQKQTQMFTTAHADALMMIFQGRSDGLPKLLSEAKQSPALSSFPKLQLEAQIRRLAVKEKRGNDSKPNWYRRIQ